MLRRLLFTLLPLSSALAGLSFAAPQQGFRIAGVVVDSVSGATLERAEVTIAPVANLSGTLVSLSSPDGKFLFAGLAPGKYRISASRPGYTQQGFDQHEGFMTAIAVGPKLDSEHIRFRLSRESLVAGNVSDDYGEPVRDAAVFLFQFKLFSGARTTRSIARATTDDLGNYRFAHLAPGTYSVAVHAKPWYTRGTNYPSANILQALNTDHSADLSVRFIESLGDQADSSRFVEPLPEPPPNPLLDVVYPTSFYSNADSLDAATPLTLAPGATATADFSLHPIPALHMLVKIPSSAEASAKPRSDGEENTPDSTEALEASLSVAGVDLDNLPTQRSSRLPGFYEISGIPPGQVVISAGSNERGRSSIESRSFQVSSDTQIDMSPQGTLVSVSGSIASFAPPAAAAGDDSQPDPPLIKFTTSDGHNSYSSSIGAKGEFALSVPAGSYQVGIALEPAPHVGSIEAKGANVSGRTVALAPGMPAKLVLHLLEANCTVTGTALKNGKPLGGVMILLVPEDPSQDSKLFHRDQSDSDGTFTLGQVLPGRYTLLAIENGWDLEWSNLSVLFKYLPNGKPIDLKPGAQISANLSVQ